VMSSEVRGVFIAGVRLPQNGRHPNLGSAELKVFGGTPAADPKVSDLRLA
jgi:hypothetical protein